MSEETPPWSWRGPVTTSRRAALLAVVGAAAALSGCRGGPSSTPSPSSASPTTSSPTTSQARFFGDPGPGRLYLGISLGIDQLAASAPELGGTNATLSRRFYRPHQIALMEQMLTQDVAAGIVPFVSFKTEGSWASVAAGEHDAWLDQLIAALDGLGSPAFLALHHEPENDVSGDNTASSWVEMQRRLIRRTAGTPHVIAVPTLMSYTFQPHSGRQPHRWLVPEASVIGVDMYNPWREGSAGNWVEFADLYADVANLVGEQPVIVPEAGTTADPFDPLRAAQWFEGAFDTAVREGIAGLAWFDYRLLGGQRRQLDRAARTKLRELSRRPEVYRFRP